jgi:CHAT domain-containing protein
MFDSALEEGGKARDALTPDAPADVRFETAVYSALATWRKDHDEGERLMRNAASEAAAANWPFDEANAFSNLAYFNNNARRYDAAIRYGTQAVAAARRAGARRVLASASANLATTYDELGLYDDAAPLLEAAIPIAREIEERRILQDALGELGHLWILQEQYDKAIPFSADAYETLKDKKWAGNVAFCHVMLRNAKEAESWNERARPENPEKDPTQNAYYLSNAVEIARLQGDYTGAVKTCREALNQVPRGSNAERALHGQMGALRLAMGDRNEARREFEFTLRDIETGQQQLSDDSMRFGYLSRLIEHYRTYVDGLVKQGDYDSALQIVERSRARVLAMRIGKRAKAEAFDARELARRTGSTLLSYWLAPERSYLWAVTAAGTRLKELPPSKEIDELVQTFRKDLEQKRDDILSDGAGKRLYELLIQPVADLIPPGGQVIVVPDGSLHYVNLESLPAPGPPVHYWLQDAVVSVAPALSLIEPGTDRAAGGSVLAIGAPVTVDERNYPALPGTRVEMENLRRLFRARALQAYEGVDATPDAFTANAAQNASIIHFAAHGESNEQAPLESAVILSRSRNGNYKLYARDLQEINLHADLVTVSGCKSAGSRSYAGEGLLGFAWAFLQSGARTVVAGLWYVRDRPTTELMRRMYEEIAAGKVPAQALHDSKVEMVRGEPQNWRRPYNWAAFQCYVRAVAAGSEKISRPVKREGG